MDNDTIRKVVYEYRFAVMDGADPLAEVNELARQGWDAIHWATNLRTWFAIMRRECGVIHMSIVPKDGNPEAL